MGAQAVGHAEIREELDCALAGVTTTHTGEVERDVEVRRVTLTNADNKVRELEITSYQEVVLLLAWGRAILLQFAHPLVAAGVAEHSLFIKEPRGRLRRLRHTLGAMLALFASLYANELAGKRLDARLRELREALE